MVKSQSFSQAQSAIQLPLRLWTAIRNEANEWPVWWKSLPLFQKLFPGVSIFLYWSALFSVHGLKTDHLAVGTAILALSYLGRMSRGFLGFTLPFFLTLIVYDSQRFYSDYIRGPIHVSEPYLFDRTFFGIQTQQGVLTPNEWWQLHTHPLLDLLTGFAYLVFFTVFILLSGYFAVYLGQTGTSKFTPKQVAARAKRMPWAFFWLNVVGYSTYYWYAAAPPWYVSLYGLGPARLDVPANSAGCARFDQILGTHFFSEMYGRAADVFGAIPSLHVAYPLLGVLFAFQLGSARIFSILFYALMCFSAVYLNHHYVLDILWGSTYAVIIGYLTNWYYDQKEKKSKTL
jgi:membrane-associated phospholipid phosphatase